MTLDDQQVLDELQRRFTTLLPEEYQDRYEDLQPLPMGSAGVRYGADGKIAWDQMWGSFCDLAMAAATWRSDVQHVQKQLRVLGLVCVFMAAKIEEVHPPKAAELVAFLAERGETQLAAQDLARFEVEYTRLARRPVFDLHGSIVVDDGVAGDDADDGGGDLLPCVEFFFAPCRGWT